MKLKNMRFCAVAFCAWAEFCTAFGVVISWPKEVMREKIDLSNLVALPIGLELGRFEGYDIPDSGGMVTCKVPPELGKGGRCAALRVSDVFVECGSRRILGGMGSNVYPTVDEGIYAMTNQIVAAVMKVSSGKATVTRLQMNRQGGYGEVKFWWKGEDAAKETELVVRGYVNAATGGLLNTIFTLRMTLKVMDSNGASVDGMPTWVRQLPILDAADDPMNYYQMLFDQWASDMTTAVAQKASRWRVPAAAADTMVEFHVSTTIDKTVAELESQTRGAKGEQLQELRRVVGGVTVELDGAVIGSAPGSFRVASGLHQLRVTRAWMKPYVATVSISEGMTLEVALELSDEGVRKWGSIEAMRADLAKRYADAARERGVRINLDTSKWRDVGNSGVRVLKDN